MPPLLLALSALALCWILLPFYGAILWALIIAILFAPVYRHLLPLLQHRRNLAAGLVMLLVFLVGVLPFALVTAALGRDASVVYRRIESGDLNLPLLLRGLFDALPAWAARLLARVGLANFDNVQRHLTAALAQGSQFMATQAFGIGMDTFDFIASVGVALYLAFFLVRDSDALARVATMALPVAPQFKEELVVKFLAVLRATVKGSLLVACIQGMLGGFAFWFLGIKGALLWAAMMAFLSLLPLIGAGLVWLPVAVYLLLTGQTWQSLALVAYGLFVIGLVDNLLRPILVGKDAGMPDYVVMITTLGGMSVLGVNGFIIGPTVAAVFIAVWHLSMAAPHDRARPPS